MILIPGLSSEGEVWATTVARYKDKYVCHVLTLAGFAGEPPLTAPSLEKVRDDLIAYIREEKLDKPVIVGHSLGGFMALWLATKEPNLVGKLVIVDGLAFIPAASVPNATVEMMKPQAEQIRKAINDPQTPEQKLQMQTAILKTMITDSSKIDLATKWGLASDSGTITQAMYEMFTTDLRPDLAKIKSPTLVVGTWIGLQQYATRESVENVFRDQFAKLADYQFVMSETSKHFVMFDDPDTLYKAMDNFLAGRKFAVSNSDERALVNLIKQMTTAQTGFDTPTLEKIYASDYVEVSPVGEVDAREKAIGFYKPEANPNRDKLKMTAIVDDFSMRPYKDFAVVIARVTFTPTANDASACPPVSIRATIVCRKENGVWKINSVQAAGIRPPRPQPTK